MQYRKMKDGTEVSVLGFGCMRFPRKGGRIDMEEAEKMMEEYPVKRSPAEWALRWLWNQPQVTVVLSGMNSMEMLDENIRVASETRAGEMTAEDFELISRVKEEIEGSMKVGCTGCGYCMPCPGGVDIPAAFACYNRMYTEEKRKARIDYITATACRKESGDYSKCIECGKCELHCPQHIPIREKLKEAGGALMPWHYRLVRSVLRRIIV